MAEEVESSESGNLFNKIIAIAAGEAHTLALTGKQTSFKLLFYSYTYLKIEFLWCCKW